MIYDTKGAAWGRLVGHKDKRMQTFIAFWGLDSAFGQMRQLGMLSDDEIRVLSPPLMGSKKSPDHLLRTLLLASHEDGSSTFILRVYHLCKGA